MPKTFQTMTCLAMAMISFWMPALAMAQGEGDTSSMQEDVSEGEESNHSAFQPPPVVMRKVPVKKPSPLPPAMISRRGEIAWQLESGLLTGYAAGFFSQPLYWSLDSPTGGRPVAFVIGISSVAALSAGASVYATGRINGSRADWKMVLLGAVAGAGLNIALASGLGYLEEPTDNSLVITTAPAMLALLPVVGSVVGYQLSSSWRTGETVHREGPSFYVLPTSQGMNAGLGFRF